MFKLKTVFVIGAGASKEFGFPLGSELAETIREETFYNENQHGSAAQLIRAANEAGHDWNASYAAASAIHNGIAYSLSIDDFLHQRQGNDPLICLGKLAIAKTILERERVSVLYAVNRGDQTLGTAGLHSSWLFKLMRMLAKDLTPATASRIFDSVTFIVFNYDRSLEVFLAHAIAESFTLPIAQARAIVGKAPILHVYGSIGGLPDYANERPIGFGIQHAWMNYRDVASHIQTYTESARDQADANFIERKIDEAEQIVFLGCGYHKQNIDLLCAEGDLFNKALIGTTQGLSPTSVDAVIQRLAKRFHSSVLQDKATLSRGFHKMSCSEFMDEYALALAGD